MLLLALLVLVVASPFGQRQSYATPQLRVVTLRPFEVVGTGFRASETVRVNVSSNTAAASTKDVAGRRGGIDVRFSRLKLGTCPQYVVSARGSKGSRAAVRSIPRACGIDPGPAR